MPEPRGRRMFFPSLVAAVIVIAPSGAVLADVTLPTSAADAVPDAAEVASAVAGDVAGAAAETAQTVADAVSGVAGSAAQTATAATQAVDETASEATETVAEAAETTTGAASDATDAVTGTVADVVETATGTATDPGGSAVEASVAAAETVTDGGAPSEHSSAGDPPSTGPRTDGPASDASPGEAAAPTEVITGAGGAGAIVPAERASIGPDPVVWRPMSWFGQGASDTVTHVGPSSETADSTCETNLHRGGGTAILPCPSDVLGLLLGVTGATILSLVVLAFVLSAAGAVSLMLNRRLQRAG